MLKPANHRNLLFLILFQLANFNPSGASNQGLSHVMLNAFNVMTPKDKSLLLDVLIHIARKNALNDKSPKTITTPKNIIVEADQQPIMQSTSAIEPLKEYPATKEEYDDCVDEDDDEPIGLPNFNRNQAELGDARDFGTKAFENRNRAITIGEDDDLSMRSGLINKAFAYNKSKRRSPKMKKKRCKKAPKKAGFRMLTSSIRRAPDVRKTRVRSPRPSRNPVKYVIVKTD